MKITPKPIAFSDQTERSRDAAGWSRWAYSSRSIGFIMLMLGWFTIPAEVFLRRDFGKRWFTVVNFYAGAFLLLLFATIQYIFVALWSWIQNFISGIASAVNPFYKESEPTFADRLMDKSMTLFLVTYLVMGSYHLFKIWWRDRENIALHSFDDGTSRLESVASFLAKPVNVIAIPFVWLYVRLIPKSQREHRQTPKLINDTSVFANTAVEPLLLFFAAWWMNGIASIWLLISAIALSIHAHWRETARLNKVLDFKDSIVEAATMRELKDEHGKLGDKKKRSEKADSLGELLQRQPTDNSAAPAIQRMKQPYPDLMNIIEEMNKDGAHLKN